MADTHNTIPIRPKGLVPSVEAEQPISVPEASLSLGQQIRMKRNEMIAQDSMQRKAAESNTPAVVGHHEPSSWECILLSPIELLALQPETRHEGKIIFLNICSVAKQNGAVFTVVDPAGTQGQLWTLMVRPFGGQTADYAEHTLFAVREPYLGRTPTGETMICVHHPTDIVWISPFEFEAQLFPKLCKVADGMDFMKEGNAAFVQGKNIAAVDAYGRGAEIAQDLGTKHNFFVKRASAYSRLGNHQAALHDAEFVLATDPKKVDALQRACAAALEVGKLSAAQAYLQTLKAIKADATSAKLSTRVERRLLVNNTEGCNLTALVKGMSGNQVVTDAGSYVGNTEIRPSAFGGLGLFATKSASVGELLLCEKPLAVTCSLDGYTEEGLRDILPDRVANGRKLALLQELVSKVRIQPELHKELFDLHASPDVGNKAVNRWNPLTFNIYQALSILDCNFYSVSAKTLADCHYQDEESPDWEAEAQLTGADRCPGIWTIVSRVNHSCVPNATWCWIGDLLILRAMHNIGANEEITVSYVPREYIYSERTEALEKQFDVVCRCIKCVADAALSIEDQDFMLRGYMQRDATSDVHRHGLTQPQAIAVVANAIAAPLKIFDPERCKAVPCLELADPLMQLAYVYLGGSHGHLWREASGMEDLKTKGAACFMAGLEIGLGFVIAIDETSGFCDLVYTDYCVATMGGVISLMCLAELAHVTKGSVEQARSVKLQHCARKMYLVVYGEDSSFDKYLDWYDCRKLLKQAKNQAQQSDKDQKQKSPVRVRDRRIPAFLRLEDTV